MALPGFGLIDLLINYPKFRRCGERSVTIGLRRLRIAVGKSIRVRYVTGPHGKV